MQLPNIRYEVKQSEILSYHGSARHNTAFLRHVLAL